MIRLVMVQLPLPCLLRQSLMLVLRMLLQAQTLWILREV